MREWIQTIGLPVARMSDRENDEQAPFAENFVGG